MDNYKRDALKKTISSLPNTSGIYLMKDKRSEVIYIGKAARLRSRVRSYFSKGQSSPKIAVLKDKISSIEYINTPTEIEALLLEAQLINKFNPRYNTLLKDDKSYPLLKVSREEYPRITITRSKTERRAKYYGPYTDAKLLREAVKLINTIFPIRKCIRLPKTPCLYYYLNQCLAPCFRKGVKGEYNRYIREIDSFLRGSKKSFIEYLTRRMKEASRKYNYEEADMFKKQIQALERLKLKKYSIIDPGASISFSGSMELKNVLSLKKVPQKVICFDVSNIRGKWAVASKVSFFREIPDKNYYRRYKIKTVDSIDDYRMIREALHRMLVGIKEGREKFRPDLIIIDGGRGHLNVAYKELCSEGFEYIPCIAIAKQFEMVFQVNDERAIPLVEGSPALNLIKRMRDEAHRFAIQYHKKLRGREMLNSQIDSIRGIGKIRKERLFKHFGSFDALVNASVKEISEVEGFDVRTAERLLRYILKLKR